MTLHFLIQGETQDQFPPACRGAAAPGVHSGQVQRAVLGYRNQAKQGAIITGPSTSFQEIENSNFLGETKLHKAESQWSRQLLYVLG